MKKDKELEESLNQYYQIAPTELALTLSAPAIAHNPLGFITSMLAGEAVNQATNYISDGEHPTFGHIIYQGDNPWLRFFAESANPGYFLGAKIGKGYNAKTSNARTSIPSEITYNSVPGKLSVSRSFKTNINRALNGYSNKAIRSVTGKDPITGLPIEGGGFRFDPKAISVEIPSIQFGKAPAIAGYPGFNTGTNVYFATKPFKIPGLRRAGKDPAKVGDKYVLKFNGGETSDFLRPKTTMKAKDALVEAQIKLDALKSAVGKLPKKFEVRGVVRNGVNAGKMYIGDNFAIEVPVNGNTKLHINNKEYPYAVPKNGSTPVFEGLNNNLSPAASSTPGTTFGGFAKNLGKGALKGTLFPLYLPYKFVKWGAPKLGSNSAEVIGGIAGSAVPLYFGRELYLKDLMEDNGGLLPIHNEGLQRLKGYKDITDAEKFRDSIANEQIYDPTIPSISESNSRAKFTELANEYINSMYDSLKTNPTTTTTTPTTTQQQTNPVPPGGAYTVGKLIKPPFQGN